MSPREPEARSEGLGRLAHEIRAQGGLLAAAVKSDDALGPPEPEPGPAQITAAGPRARGHEGEYELLVAAIEEGYELHYGRGRVVSSEDPDLALLAGDHLYALGLSLLAALGDLEGVAELADLIALCAQSHAEGDPGRADATWEASAAALGWGRTPDHQRAKGLARASTPGAADALRAAARHAQGKVAPAR